eukprot:8060542-Pyramimonas_sp.AAC.1
MFAGRLNLSSIGYLSLPKSIQAGSAVSRHLDRCCRFAVGFLYLTRAVGELQTWYAHVVDSESSGAFV